jgi:superfamily II DNA or RNA helicase
VVVPTIDLIDQWVAKLSEVFGVDVGRLGGGESDIKPVTVSTYDSALIRAESLGNRFQFLVVDEVHHLPSPQYRHIAEMYCAPSRLGLTATYERADLLHLELESLMGGKIFERGYAELTEYLADFSIVKMKVELDPDEIGEYERERETFTSYLRHHRMRFRGPWDFEGFIRRSWNPEGREALMAWRRAREIAFNPKAKLAAVRTILSRHRGERTIIFTEETAQAYALAQEILAPCLTYKTPDEERAETLARFKDGRSRILVTSRVLDEGVDVPEASLAIVLSGSGSPRQFRQRLGRILRPGAGKVATLYEVLSVDTTEMGTSARRKKGMGAVATTRSEGGA